MTYSGIIQKSKTVDLTVLVGIMGIVETNFGFMQESLGKWYGVSYIALAIAFYLLRRVTDKPLSEK